MDELLVLAGFNVLLVELYTRVKSVIFIFAFTEALSLLLIRLIWERKVKTLIFAATLQHELSIAGIVDLLFIVNECKLFNVKLDDTQANLTQPRLLNFDTFVWLD